MKKLLFILVPLLLIQTVSAQTTVKIDEWLMAGPELIQMPAFSDVKNVDGKLFGTSDLLKHTASSEMTKFAEPKQIKSLPEGLELGKKEEYKLLYFKSWLSVDRYTEATINLILDGSYMVYQKGQKVVYVQVL